MRLQVTSSLSVYWESFEREGQLQKMIATVKDIHKFSKNLQVFWKLLEYFDERIEPHFQSRWKIR